MGGARMHQETESDNTKVVAAGDEGVVGKMDTGTVVVGAAEKYEAGDARYSVDGMVSVGSLM